MGFGVRLGLNFGCALGLYFFGPEFLYMGKWVKTKNKKHVPELFQGLTLAGRCI